MDGGFRDDQPQLRVPPMRLDAEQAVLGGLMQRPEAWPMVAELLREEDFYQRRHQLIWRAIKALAERKRGFDAITLGDFLEAKGFSEEVERGAYLVELASTAGTAANIVAHAEIVGEVARLRRMIELGTILVNNGYQPDGRDVAELLTEAQEALTELQPAQRGGLRRVAESIGDWYDRFCARFDRKESLTGLPTPWAEFNRITHGLQPATLYLIAARPSMGKSVMGLNLASMLALRGKTVGLFSLEMSEDDCHNRNVSSLACVPHDWLIAPDAATDHTAAVNDAYRQLRDAPLFIDDMPALNVRQFEARARRLHQRHPLDLLAIDHIHDFKIDPKLARFEYGAIAQCAKNLGKEWGIPVVALAQLNRNVSSRTGSKRPTLADLRESGELEQKADVVVFLHREDYYDEPDNKTHLQGVVEAIIAKGRNIRAGATIYLQNRFDQMRLDDWTGPLPKPPPKKAKGAAVGFDDEDPVADRQDIFG